MAENRLTAASMAGQARNRLADLVAAAYARVPSASSVLNGVMSGATEAGQGMLNSAISGVTLPRDVYEGRVDPYSEEAVGRALDMAGFAMTGSLPFGAPKGALRSFGGAVAKDDPLAALEAGLQDYLTQFGAGKTEAQITAELAAKGPSFGGTAMAPRETMRLDPRAKSWDVYHGSEPGPDFARFDPQISGTPSERGAVFFAPNPESASGYARATQSGAEAGSRVYRATVDPGRTAVFDLPYLAETDAAFNARARQLMIDDNGAWAAPHHDSYMDMFRADRASSRVANEKAVALGGQPSDLGGISYGHGHIGAAIERAKAQGLDTAILRGLAEHGGDDQVIALTPGRVRSYYDPSQLLYSGGPGGSLMALIAASANQDGQQGRNAFQPFMGPK